MQAEFGREKLSTQATNRTVIPICLQRDPMHRGTDMPPERSQAVPFVAEALYRLTYSFDRSLWPTGAWMLACDDQAE